MAEMSITDECDSGKYHLFAVKLFFCLFFFTFMIEKIKNKVAKKNVNVKKLALFNQNRPNRNRNSIKK